MNVKEKLFQAINARNTIECSYHEKKRFIEPYHFGILGGEEQLHCFQYAGESESGGIPQWRNLKLQDIRSIRILDSHFLIRESYHPENAHYSFIENGIYRR
ncbi:hypothetical protein [Legionella jamestowniensis]|uniref:WYL domain-containing protein n=1 Tax=Legionella jamestowniensis TaxID=455 RepID=A0A0W0UGL8_9GAMM|nr:hypothetical protein [Legionella jamestowniensis]KTD07044.1 hypothetical protein Ljam_1239 [Legionella jamestowniensis]OCH96727.1 hypothetical protein A8135_06085 [Legionella jamestowniensis]SFM03322.1 hypothetical protein SAMN02746073_0041 [Legionella jamestowniensis DSM 19215]